MDLRLRSMFDDPAARERLGLPALDVDPSPEAIPPPAVADVPPAPAASPSGGTPGQDARRELLAALKLAQGQDDKTRALSTLGAGFAQMGNLIGRRNVKPAQAQATAVADLLAQHQLGAAADKEGREAQLFGPQLRSATAAATGAEAKAPFAGEEAASDAAMKRAHAQLFGQQTTKGAADLADAQAFREALRSGDSRATAVVVALARKYNPELAAKLEGATGSEIYPLLPTMTKDYAAEQAAARAEALLRDRVTARREAAGRGSGDVQSIADAVESGAQPPDLRGLYRLGAPVKAELSRRGFNLSNATTDWQATQRHLATLNGPQQTRLRQAVDATGDQLDNVERLYGDWKRAAGVSGVRVFNRASLAAAKQLPGDAGAVAQALEGQISLLTGELGNVLMGGNSPTDHGLQLAGTMLAGDWNEETFKKGLENLRRDIQIRRNSMMHSSPAGASAGNKYAAPAGSEAAQGRSGTVARPRSKAERDALPAGTQYIGPDGGTYVKK